MTDVSLQADCDDQHVSPEDNATLWQWMAFVWIWPTLALGRTKTLTEADTWLLSPFLRSKVVFEKYRELADRSLFVNLLIANGLDLLLDGGLQIGVVCLQLVGPFFLKQILESLDPSNTVEERLAGLRYVFAAFIANLVAAELDLIHSMFAQCRLLRIHSRSDQAIMLIEPSSE